MQKPIPARVARIHLIVTSLIVVFFALAAYPVHAQDDSVDVRAVVKDFEKAFARAKTGAERLALVDDLPDETGDERLVKSLIAALEKNLKSTYKVQRELDKAREQLAPYEGRKLRDAEWNERDRLEAEVGRIGGELSMENDIALAIVDKLVDQESEEVIDYLSDYGLRNRSWRVRSEILQALGRMRTEESRQTIVVAMTDKDPRVRQIAVEAAAQAGGKGMDEQVMKRLKDDEWPVRSAAVAALVRLRSEAAVGPLILMMGEERGRLRDDCAAALGTLTSESFGTNVRAWRDWWVENYMEPLDVRNFPKVEGRGVSYHEVKTSSTAIMYVIDISDSMNEDAGVDNVEAGLASRDSAARSKYDVMIKELIRTIASLPDSTTFNIIVYNHEVRRWKDEMQPATKKAKNEALEYLLEVEPVGGTNIFDSLEKAFESAGLGAKDRYYKPLVDTIFFLSDGAPSTGRITDTKEILREIDRLNRFRRLTIHTIGVGALHDKEFMKRLADAHGGTYVQRL